MTFHPQKTAPQLHTDLCTVYRIETPHPWAIEANGTRHVHIFQNEFFLPQRKIAKTEHNWVGIHPLYSYTATVDGQLVTAKTWLFFLYTLQNRFVAVAQWIFPEFFGEVFWLLVGNCVKSPATYGQCFMAMNPTLWVSSESQMPKKQHPKPGERIFLSKNICISWDGKLSHQMMKKIQHWVCNECPTKTAGTIPSCWLHVGGIYSKQHPNKKGHD